MERLTTAVAQHLDWGVARRGRIASASGDHQKDQRERPDAQARGQPPSFCHNHLFRRTVGKYAYQDRLRAASGFLRAARAAALPAMQFASVVLRSSAMQDRSG